MVVLYASISVLNLMRAATGSQCRSSRMRIDDLESAFAIRKASVTESSAVSVECPRLKPDWLAFSRVIL